MAPSRTPGQKNSKGDYAHVGVQGRKTGLTVPELGPRDNEGFEPLGELFSSPQKGPTPARTNGARHHSEDEEDDEDEDEDEAMEIANGTSDNASSVLRSARRSVNLPPSSRTPLRTSLGGSPKRPQGLGSSPLQNRALNAGKRSSLLVPPRRSGNFVAPPSPAAKTAQRGRPALSKPDGRARTQTYELLDDDEEEEEEEEEEGEEEMEAVDEGQPDDQDDSDAGVGVDAGAMEDDEPVALDEDTNVDNNQEMDEDQESPLPEPQPVKRGRKRKSTELEADQPVDTGLTKQGQPPKKRGRPPKNKKPAPEEDSAQKETTLVREPSPVNGTMGPPKKRGRGPGQRNPKARISSGKIQKADKESAKPRPEKEAANEVSDSETKKGRRKPKSRPMLHLQETEEAEEEVAPVLLRSGRTSVKPLAYWRGEQIVYEPPKRVGKDLLPGGYRGVDPGRKEVESKPRTTHRRKGGRRKAVSREPEGAEEDDDDQELWETEGENPGILKAGVLAWDAELQEGTEDEYHEMELAITATALENRMKDDKGKTFCFAKTVTLPFFHSGVVDLPPVDGIKRSKNSRKNHMIFWVFSGRVQVEVSGTVFSIGAGGMWQVPRGNTYEIANPFPRKARIFFSQGNYMDTDDEAALLAAEAA